jgi:hypothetical protein
MRLNRILTLGTPPTLLCSCSYKWLSNFLLNLTIWLPPHSYWTGHSKRVSLVHPVLEACHLLFMTTTHYSSRTPFLFILGKFAVLLSFRGLYFISLGRCLPLGMLCLFPLSRRKTTALYHLHEKPVSHVTLDILF